MRRSIAFSIREYSIRLGFVLESSCKSCIAEMPGAPSWWRIYFVRGVTGKRLRSYLAARYFLVLDDRVRAGGTSWCAGSGTSPLCAWLAVHHSCLCRAYISVAVLVTSRLGTISREGAGGRCLRKRAGSKGRNGALNERRALPHFLASDHSYDSAARSPAVSAQ
jgi:hypothetical protein